MVTRTAMMMRARRRSGGGLIKYGVRLAAYIFFYCSRGDGTSVRIVMNVL